MLIPAGRKKILDVFMKRPFEEIHLRQIARMSKASLNNANDSMRMFTKDGMFKRRDISNMTFYRPNLNNDNLLKTFEFLELGRRKKFYSSNKKISRLLQDYVQQAVELSNKKIQLVILFGSVARGEWTQNSDIDILVVVSEKDRSILNALNKAGVNSNPLLSIQPVTTTTKNFLDGLSKKTEFYEEVWRDRVVLYNEFLFWQLVKETKGPLLRYSH